MNTSPIQFYLASASPRRRELLAAVGLCFECIPVDIDEHNKGAESAMAFVSRLALEKVTCAAESIAQNNKPDLPILAADTCVTINDQILGKPSNSEHAVAMLRLLSGQTHEVLTAIALRSNDTVWQDLSRTRVTFAPLSKKELITYCASDEPLDKAGAYAIQGRASAFVKYIEGSYTGVVGLPMYETRRLLAKIGIDWL